MRQLVSLYINDRKVDFREPFHINLTYTMEDVTNPPAVKNNYSKTVIVEGTPKNNQIFSNLWNIQTVAGGMAYEYDLTRKNSFKLYLNGEMMESGYVKLDKIVNKVNIVEYHITLYGGLGDFFYNLSMKEDGTPRKLCDIDYGGGEKEFDVVVNKTNVMNFWWYLSYGTNYNKSVVEDKINFAPCYNGIPEEWDTKKFMVDINDNPFALLPKPSGPSAKGGVMIADITGDRDYTEWEAGDLRSYMQRPVLRFRALMEAICDPKNNGGYKVELDPTFFNTSNPYYEKSWITLPLLKDTDADSVDETVDISFSPTHIKDNLMQTIPITLDSDTGPVDYNKGKLNVNFSLTFIHPLNQYFVYTSYPYSAPTPPKDKKDNKTKSSDSSKYYNGAFCIQLLAKDPEGKYVYASPVQVLSSYPKSFNVRNYGYIPKLSTSFRYSTGRFVKDEGTNRYTWDKPISLEMDNMLLSEGMTFEISIEKVHSTNDTSYNFPPDTLYRPHSGIEINPQRSMVIESPVYIEGAIIKDKARSSFSQSSNDKTLMTKKRILNSEGSPLDYLLGYTKQMGLYFLKDPVAKTVSIMTRNTFYNNQEIVDLTSKIDRSKDMTITPIAFDKKWYDFALKIEKSKYAEMYKKTYNSNFGIQRVDTNYEYDKKSKNLLDKNVYKSAVMLREHSNYKVNFELYYDSDNSRYYLPGAFIDGAKFSLFEPDRTLKEVTDIDLPVTKNNYRVPIYSGKKFYDRVPLMCFYDKERKPVDGSNVLCFFNGTVKTADVTGSNVWLRLTDDTDQMNELNDNKPCWLYSKTKSTELTFIPVFGRYYTNGGKTVQASFNMGNPIETYTFDYSFNSLSSIYGRYWRNFLVDQYDKNTRVMECYVKMDRRVMQDYLRKLFFFDGAFWCLLEVDDFDICNFETTKCKFIKVQNPDVYQNGQYIRL